MMKLIFEGHACFRVVCGGREILIDPYISANPLCQKEAAEFSPDLILVTHGHGDHLGDAVPIARRCGATLAAQVDLVNAIDHKGVETVGFNLGGSFDFQGVRITMVPAWHGNGIAAGGNNVYAGLACGYIIDDGARKVYHAGDTALFGDMAAVISRYGIDCALLPIGDFYTMGPADAVTAAEWLQAETVIPMHYDTFPAIRQDAEAFRRAVEEKTDSRCVVLRPGEAWEM
ncbi:MAG: metal-dependent hydrolase [Firmicutes bacterium]|nr:metal-dependent hydrolase [Bacillota bacterium]